VLEVLQRADGDSAAVSASGWLAEDLPDEPTPLRFRMRTSPAGGVDVLPGS
jgi:hypothetical protein